MRFGGWKINNGVLSYAGEPFPPVIGGTVSRKDEAIADLARELAAQQKFLVSSYKTVWPQEQRRLEQKVIVIERCTQCPHIDKAGSYCRHPKAGGHPMANVGVYGMDSIPTFCPLEDA